MAKRNESGRFVKEYGWEYWINKATQIIPLLVAFYALYQTQQSVSESKRSADVAQDQLEIQRKETVKSQLKDSLDGVQDSLRNAKFIELSSQQILALRQQADALQKEVRHTEISQQPFISVEHLVFQAIGNSQEKFALTYRITNLGMRPALLKEVKVCVFDKELHLVDIKSEKINTTITRYKYLIRRLGVLISGKEYNILTGNEIESIKGAYFCFQIVYFDPFVKRNFVVDYKSSIYKRVDSIEDSIGALFFDDVDQHWYFGTFEICDDDETPKVVDAIKKVNKYTKKGQ